MHGVAHSRPPPAPVVSQGGMVATDSSAASLTADNDDLEFVEGSARAMGLRPGRGQYAHICARCLHSSSRHLSHDGGLIYTCPCGCEVASDNPGMWLSERDFAVWDSAFPCPQARPLTVAQRRALEWLDRAVVPARPAFYARYTYPPVPPRARSGQRRAAGALFSRLEQAGLARVVDWVYGVPLYEITDAGREALRR